jgi:PAS domain S-box-containing protein
VIDADALLANAADVVSAIDADGAVRYQSPAVERVLGYEQGALRGDSVLSYVHDADRSAVRDLLTADAGPDPVEHRFRHADGSWVPLETRRSTDYDVDDGCVVVTSRDIGRKRRREPDRTVETLHELYEVAAATDLTLAQKRSHLLETGSRHLDLPYGIVTRITDNKQMIVDAVGDHELLQCGASCPIEESYCRKTIDTDGLLAIQSTVEAEEEWGDDPAYERFELGSYIGGRIEVDGDLYGTLCFASTAPRDRAFTDGERSFVELASRWLAYEFEQARYQRRLERQNERLDNFASILSHDLRNPLNVAQGRLRLAAERYDDDDIDAARAALDRTFDLVDDVLAFSRAGGDVLDPEPTALDTVARQAWTIVDPSAATLDIAPDVGTVAADRTRLQQLLENLFDNAATHGGDGVTVSLGRLDDDEGFYVADDGPGISPDRRDRVFEPGHTDAADGSGLGLAIVREIATAHDWGLTVVASATGGTRFEVVTEGSAPMSNGPPNI